MRDVFCGLVYLHDKNIIHLDMKVENIVIVNGRVKIIDFAGAIVPEQRCYPSTSIEYTPPGTFIATALTV
jgi:serine/threonine protein kinase